MKKSWLIGLLIVAALAAWLLVRVAWMRVPLPGRPADVRPVEVGEIDSKRIAESSGLVESRTHPGVFWTHNDKGNAAAIYAITREGELIGEFKVDARNDDWEDISIDDGGHLYIARTGNNDAKKDEVSVLRIDEPDPRGQRKEKLEVDRVWPLRYPRKPFDAESLFIHGGHGYLISKLSNDKPAGIYRFPLDEGEEPQTLEFVTELPITSPVTAADISKDATHLAVLCAGGLVVFPINGEISRTATATPIHYRLPDLKFEGCAFTIDGLLLTAESREIYFCPLQAIAATGS